MDSEAFRERVAEAKATELDRLGSEKLLIALTDAELDRETVLSAAADSEHAARRTFETWADEESGDAAEAFAREAEQEADHYERVVEHLDGHDPNDGGSMHSYLRNRGSTVERAAGLVGRGLVSDRTHLQVVNFFVNEGDGELADLFRDLRTETGEATERGLDLLGDECVTDENWETADAVAEYTIQLAYDEYADALRAMGMDPKPIC